MADDFKFEILRDIASFGEGKWQKHLTLISWNGKEPVYDIRPWNEDMTRMGKGVSLTKDDLYDLSVAIEGVFEGSKK